MPIILEYEHAGRVYETRFCLEIGGELLDLSNRVTYDLVVGERTVARVDLNQLFGPIKRMFGQESRLVIKGED